MPGKVKVKIIAGRNLPVMDRSSDTTDAYVEIKLGSTTYKTDVCRKSLNPQWNSEWYRFEVDDSELQDEPLQIRLMDYDTYSANDAIGKVYLDLNPLLLPSSGLLPQLGWNHDQNSSNENITNSVMSGWIPVYDTMHGIRGEVNVIVKVELFSDFNKFRQSSCGVQFFCSPTIPHGYQVQVIHGFVEELVVNDDPEYQWIDKIRTPRASNEARQILFLKLSGELQRKIGVKALELGGNAVVGYCQSFDLEGESGIVARGIGTAVSLIKVRDSHLPTVPLQAPENTDERALNYLKFLGSGSSFYLGRAPDGNFTQHSNNPFPLPSQSLPRNSFDCGELDLPDRQHLSSTDVQKSNSASVVQPASSMQSLLRQEDLRRNPGRGVSQRFRNIRYASRSMLSKKMSAFKAKLSEASSDEEFPFLSNSSPSLSQGGELKNRKYSLFKRSTSDSSVMAQILIHSVMQSNLECIEESVDNSPSKDMYEGDGKNKLELGGNFLEEILHDVDSSSVNISEKLNTSSTSSDSSETDDESDSKDEKSIEYDTISNVIKNAEIIEHKKNMQLAVSEKPDNCFENLNICDEVEEPSTQDIQKMLNLGNNCIQEFCLIGNTENLSQSPNEVIFENFKDELLKVPPLAEAEDFTDFDGIDISNMNNAPHDSNNGSILSKQKLKKPKFIIPPIMIGGDIEKRSLVQTAMQTMLLEKVNIIGTYSPPLSPADDVSAQFSNHSHPTNLKFSENSYQEKINSPVSSSCSLEKDQSFFPQISKTFESLRRSPTALSLDHDQQKEKVLHTSFSSVDNISNQTSRKINEKPNKIKSLEKLLHQKGLAIGHLLKEKVSDLLSHSKRDYTKAEKTKENGNQSNVPIPVQSQLSKEITAANSLSLCETSADTNYDRPSNTKIDKGTSNSFNKLHASLTHPDRTDGSPVAETNRPEQGHQRAESAGAKMPHSPVKFITGPYMHRRSSDSDLSITPKGNSFTGSDRSGGLSSHFLKPGAFIRSNVHQDNLDMLEYPFLTMSKYPLGFIIYIGGAVSARSVKLLERITNLEEPESRDTWWSELRMEIRSHARALNCNAVLGYSEATSICEDVCILSATGTAAVIGYRYLGDVGDSFSGIPVVPKLYNKENLVSSLDRNEFERDKRSLEMTANSGANSNTKQFVESPEHESSNNINVYSCNICHVPYSGNAVPLRITTSKCAYCRNAKVPDILITTIELPDGVPTSGRGCFLQAHVCRQLKDLRGESNAKDISDGLPFLEYELHRLLVNKLRVKGMNTIFGLKVRISVGVRMLIGIATGTAIFLSPLPPPPLPKLVSDRSTDSKKLADMQKILNETVKKNKEIYQIRNEQDINGRTISDNEEDENDSPVLDLSTENKDCCILEADDPEDIELMNLLMEPQPPDGFHVVNTEQVPGLHELEIVKNLQMFMQVWRAKIQPPYNLGKLLHKLLQTVYFKLRRMIPCALCDLQFRVDLPDSDDIQLIVLGMALGLAEPVSRTRSKTKSVHTSNKDVLRKHDEELIFNMEEYQNAESTQNMASIYPSKTRQKSPPRIKNIPNKIKMRGKHGVDITPLSYIPGGKIEKYLGNLNFFFIRETTSIREEGGLSGFVHSFANEVLAIARAHVTALGGNAMVAYYMTECVLYHNLHKNQYSDCVKNEETLLADGINIVYLSSVLDRSNDITLNRIMKSNRIAAKVVLQVSLTFNPLILKDQKHITGQCLINVGGDVVSVSYVSDD